MTSTKRYSCNLPQGGLEIPCQLKFTGNDKELSKTQKLARNFLNMACSLNFEQNKLAEQKDNVKKPQEDGAVLIVGDAIPAAKRRKIDIHCNAIIPTNEDLEAIIMGCKLSDVHINYAQELLKKQFPSLNGLASTLLITKNVEISESYHNKSQIFHSRKDHWIMASSVACSAGMIKVYDSSFASLDAATERLIHKEFQSHGVKSVINIMPSQKQKGETDCELFAVACATSIAFGIDPAKLKTTFDPTLLNVFTKKSFPLFL